MVFLAKRFDAAPQRRSPRLAIGIRPEVPGPAAGRARHGAERRPRLCHLGHAKANMAFKLRII